MTVIVPGKVFWDNHAQHCYLLHRCCGRMNYAPHAMPRTTFVRVSKTFPATIEAFTRNAMNAIWAHLIIASVAFLRWRIYPCDRSWISFGVRIYCGYHWFMRDQHLIFFCGKIYSKGAKVKNTREARRKICAFWAGKALKYEVLKLKLVCVGWNWKKSREAPIFYQSDSIGKKWSRIAPQISAFWK